MMPLLLTFAKKNICKFHSSSHNLKTESYNFVVVLEISLTSAWGWEETVAPLTLFQLKNQSASVCLRLEAGPEKLRHTGKYSFHSKQPNRYECSHELSLQDGKHTSVDQLKQREILF